MGERVLLVDDDEDFLEIMSERMKTRGMEVATSTSAEDALERIATGSFDAIVLDFMMPEMDGIETIKSIKSRNPELQIILLTGYATLEKGVEAIKLGAMDVVEKPADLEALAQKIKQAEARKAVIVEKRTEDRIKEILKHFGA
jgi:DNA-binding NtrC family response regulator